MPAQFPLIPIILIDSGEAQIVEVASALRKIYYQPSGYQRTAKKLHEASKQVGYYFTINEMHDWLERQILHLFHKSRLKYIPRVRFSSITTSNEMHQADVLYKSHVKSK